MDIVILSVAMAALIIAIVSLVLVLILYKEFFRSALVSRGLEKQIAQTPAGAHTDRQGTTTRVVDAPEQHISTPIHSAPDIPPEALAPLLGRPPIPKGGFGTRVKYD
jgi:hypothetical protein